MAVIDRELKKIALSKADEFCRHGMFLKKMNKRITEKMEDAFKKAGLDLDKIKSGEYGKII